MRLLSIDPSSSIIGYAIFGGQKLADAGRIVPTRATDPANVRIRTMVKDLMEIVAEARPEVIVIEDTSGKVNIHRHGGAGAGLAIYGKAVGWVIAVMERTGVRVDAVLENDWTGGQSKAERQARIAAQFRQYDPTNDPGGDVSDAIALGQWWLDEQRIASAMT